MFSTGENLDYHRNVWPSWIHGGHSGGTGRPTLQVPRTREWMWMGAARQRITMWTRTRAHSNSTRELAVSSRKDERGSKISSCSRNRGKNGTASASCSLFVGPTENCPAIGVSLRCRQGPAHRGDRQNSTFAARNLRKSQSCWGRYGQ